MAVPDSTEMVLIDKFRGEVKGILDEERLAQDDFLLRWIRARNHDLDKAKDMLINHLKWHTEKNIANIAGSPTPPFFDLHFKHFTDGEDRAGRPLYVCPAGQWNIKELLRLTTPEQVIHEFTRVMDRMRERVEAAMDVARVRSTQTHGQGLGPGGDFVGQMIAIGDYHGFGWQQANSWPAVQRMLEMGSTFEAHFPEMVRVMYFINCPRMFMWIVLLVKKIFPAGSQHKLQFYGTNVEEWWPVLTEAIDPKYLGMLNGAPVEIGVKPVMG